MLLGDAQRLLELEEAAPHRLAAPRLLARRVSARRSPAVGCLRRSAASPYSIRVKLEVQIGVSAELIEQVIRLGVGIALALGDSRVPNVHPGMRLDVRSRYRLLRYDFFEQSVLEAGVQQLHVIAGGSFDVLSIVSQLRSSDSRLARTPSIEDAQTLRPSAVASAAAH
jgi:hypothetical protein